MRFSACVLPALIVGLATFAPPAPAQLVRTIEDRTTARPPRPKPSQGPVIGPTPRPSPRLPPPIPITPSGGNAYGSDGLAPTPNVARWQRHSQARVLGRTDLVWYANRGWRCRRDDGTTGTIGGITPPGTLYRYASMSGRQSLGKIIATARSGPLGRQVDTGMVVCR